MGGHAAGGTQRRWLGVSLLALGVTSAAMLVSGCELKDEGKCQEAVSTAVQAAERGLDAQAQEWREYAYKQCGDAATLAKLDQDIVAKQTERKKAAQEKALKEQAQQKLVEAFQQWVASARANPETAAATVTCEGEDDAALKRSKERFCTRERALVGRTEKFTVRYWEKEPVAALFSFVSPEPVTCEALGGQTARQWPMPAVGGKTANRSLCTFAGGVLAGMQALATEANGAQQYVFSNEYLEKDAAFAAKLK